MDKIIIFWGSKKDFEFILSQEINEYEDVSYFMEVIQDYNAKLRPNASLGDEDRKRRITVDNLIVGSSDYASVLEHVIYNFVNVLTLNHDIGKIFLHNPPNTIVRALMVAFKDIIDIRFTKYNEITRECLKEALHEVNSKVIGQAEAKKAIISSMYKLINKPNNKPSVILLMGPSGVGKTETAKTISKVFGGSLLRIQFSMMQASDAYNYIFGSEHSRNSFARDLLERETNIVLIDEFDKVRPEFYNAFYQLFDEGYYVDSNYKVDARNCIFLCTTNFQDEERAIEKLGFPIFSRFSDIIKYSALSISEKQEIFDNIYIECISNLTQEEKVLFQNSEIYNFYYSRVDRYESIRLLRRNLEKSIYSILFDYFIISNETN